MTIDMEKSDKKSNDEYLAQLRGSSYCDTPIPIFTNAEQAETQRRIVRTKNNDHRQIYCAINNK